MKQNHSHKPQSFTGYLYATMGPLFIMLAALLYSPSTHAQVSNWDAGNIISDSVFTNTGTMSASQIQSFLNSKVQSCDTWGTQKSEHGGGTRRQWAEARGYSAPFTCIKDYSQNGKSAAQLIYDAAQKYSINPQVLIVLLQKEQGLITDTWPVNIQYRSATGYGCPDTAPCDSQYYGLTNQLDWAAKMFRAIMNASPTWYTPYIVGNNFIRYSPDASCGGSNVRIQNRATQALYNFTPYQPNQGALNAGWGTSNCGAYGNRNFYLYFTSWFGPTRYVVTGGISEQYAQIGGYSTLGFPIMNESCVLRAGACYQNFERGTIYWTPAQNKAYTLLSGIRAKWDSTGKEWGVLGYPISNEQYGPSGSVQEFENGYIHYVGGGAFYTLKIIGYDNNYTYLGSPSHDTYCGLVNGGCYQTFSGGILYKSNSTNPFVLFGGIYSKWATAGKEWGALGYPTSNEQYGPSGTIQNFENGRIIFSKGKSNIVLDKIEYFTRHSHLGSPLSDTICGSRNNGCYQTFEKGIIYQSASSGAYPIFGGIYSKWATAGKEWGALGYPTSNEQYGPSGTIQNFENGRIIWTSQSSANIIIGNN